MIKRSLKNKTGFTLIELIVASAIVALISVISTANFHTARRSDEINLAADQVVDGISTVRNLSLGGQLLTNQTFPAGGYGINLQEGQSQISLYAALDKDSNGLVDGEMIPSGVQEFSNIQIVDLCMLTTSTVITLPCQGDWVDISGMLEIIFDLSSNVSANDVSGPLVGVTYVGGVLEHNITGRQAYFYVSLVSGLVVGDIF